MKCNHCGHEGTFFPTVHISQIKKPLSVKKVKNVQHFDKTFAKGTFSIELFAFIIMFVLAGAVLGYYKQIYYSVSCFAVAIILLIIFLTVKSKNY